MNERDTLIEAVQMQRKHRKFLSLKWSAIVDIILKSGLHTHNEMSRVLDLDWKQRSSLHACLFNLRTCGKVRRVGDKFYFGEEDIKFWKQRGLSEFKPNPNH